MAARTSIRENTTALRKLNDESTHSMDQHKETNHVGEGSSLPIMIKTELREISVSEFSPGNGRLTP